MTREQIISADDYCINGCVDTLIMNKEEHDMPDWCGSIVEAWRVLQAIKKMRFSIRLKFAQNLKELKRLETGEYLKWPDALFALEPIDICRAAVLAVIEPNESTQAQPEAEQ